MCWNPTEWSAWPRSCRRPISSVNARTRQRPSKPQRKCRPSSHALWLLLLTGVRRNEILAAKWADIDWDNKTLYIGKTKNGEAVLTPLGRAAIARLKIIPRLHDNPYIICGELPG